VNITSIFSVDAKDTTSSSPIQQNFLVCQYFFNRILLITKSMACLPIRTSHPPENVVASSLFKKWDGPIFHCPLSILLMDWVHISLLYFFLAVFRLQCQCRGGHCLLSYDTSTNGTNSA
jgi:hypothetical protein